MEELQQTLKTIADREKVSEGEVMLRAKDEDGNTILHGGAMLGSTGRPPAYTILAESLVITNLLFRIDVLEFCMQHSDFKDQPGLRLSLLNIRNSDQETPVITAVKRNENIYLAALLNHGAEVDTVALSGWYAAHFAADLGHDEVLSELASRGATLDAMAETGDTPAHLAARKIHGGCFRILHEASADLVLSELASRGVSLDAMSKAGDTPAHLAARNNHAGCFRILHEAGADLRTYNDARETPVDAAVKANNLEVLEVMKEVGLR